VLVLIVGSKLRPVKIFVFRSPDKYDKESKRKIVGSGAMRLFSIYGRPKALKPTFYIWH